MLELLRAADEPARARREPTLGGERASAGTDPQKPELLSLPPSSSDMLPSNRSSGGVAEKWTAPLLLPPSCESETTFQKDAAVVDGCNTGLTSGGGADGSAKTRLLLMRGQQSAIDTALEGDPPRFQLSSCSGHHAADH